jgi:hypothetical protein
MVGGEDRAGFVRLVEEAGATRTVLVGVDVGKHDALTVAVSSWLSRLASGLTSRGACSLEAGVPGAGRGPRHAVGRMGHGGPIAGTGPCRSMPRGRRWAASSPRVSRGCVRSQLTTGSGSRLPRPRRSSMQPGRAPRPPARLRADPHRGDPNGRAPQHPGRQLTARGGGGPEERRSDSPAQTTSGTAFRVGRRAPPTTRARTPLHQPPGELESSGFTAGTPPAQTAADPKTHPETGGRSRLRTYSLDTSTPLLSAPGGPALTRPRGTRPRDASPRLPRERAAVPA